VGRCEVMHAKAQEILQHLCNALPDGYVTFVVWQDVIELRWVRVHHTICHPIGYRRLVQARSVRGVAEAIAEEWRSRCC
jgi:predicted nucleic acid-binding protein